MRRGTTGQALRRENLAGPGKLGKRYLRYRTTATDAKVVWVPVRIRREEVLAQLTAHGWPVEHR